MTALTETPNVTERDLGALVKVYGEVTERLKNSHEVLMHEVRRLREQIDEKNRELARRERLSALGVMAAGVAHEIRNPLGGIGLYASLLERDLIDRPKQRDIARKIGAGVEKLEGIVVDVLAFAGGAPPRCAPTRLSDIIDGALSVTEARFSADGACVDVSPEVRDVLWHCDEGKIRRVFVNLLVNALDAASQGAHVRIRPGDAPPWSEDDGIELYSVVVEDDGPGISADRLHKVFDPFFTTKDTGTGLGLAIAHGIAESHGGRLTVRNRRSGGAAFTLSLPVATNHVAA